MSIVFSGRMSPSRLTKTTTMEDTFELSACRIGPDFRFARRKHLPISSRSKTLPADRDFRRAALSEFWDTRFSENNTLTFANIAYSEKSPGRTFQLDEDTLAEYLDRLESLTDGALRYDETAGMKQVYRDRKIASTELLHRYYLK